MNKTLSKRGIALASAVLTLGLGTGVAAATGLDALARDASAAQLDARTAAVRGALDTTFQRYADTLHDVAALSTGALSAAVSRIPADRLPGAHQVVVVSPTGAILAQHTLDGSTPPPRTVLDPAPPLARALRTARDTGRPTAGPAHVLPADLDLPPAHRQSAVDLVAPIHDTAFRGWVVIGVRTGDLLHASFATAGISGAGLSGVATTLSETTPDGTVHQLASYGGSSTRGSASRVVDVALAGHTWQAEVRPTAALTAPSSAAPLALLVAVVVSLLLAGAVLLISALTRRAARSHDLAHTAESARTQLAAELSGFSATAGDRLQSPLHTIAGFAGLLQEEHLDEASRGFVDRIAGTTGRMLTLVDELVAYTSAGDTALKPVPVDTTGLALGVVAELLDNAPERPSVAVGDLPTVLADADLLAGLLGRLVENAARYVRPGTTPAITIGAREHAPGWWRIEVADRGIGVPEDQRARIFQPFQRASSAEGYPGTGLGLAICRRIAALHGGELGVDANPGGGSVFWFTLPATSLTPEFGPELFAANAM